MDDTLFVVENPYLKSWRHLPELLTKDTYNVWGGTNYWRPTLSISLALDYFAWGLNPIGFHLTNILLHALNTALIFSLARRLGGGICALVASLFFALHPLQAQAVNLIHTRGDLLAALFALLSVRAFLSKKTLVFVLWLTLALLSKEISVALPLMLLVAPAILQGEKLDRRHLLALAILATYFAARLLLGFYFSLPSLIFSYRASWEERLLLVFKVISLYFQAALNPFETPHPYWTAEVPKSLTDPHVLGGILILGLLIAAIWLAITKRSPAAFGLVWIVIYFLPISNLKELHQPLAEHWFYVPMIGLGIALGSALDSQVVRRPQFRLIRVSALTFAATFLAFSALVVVEKTRIYQNDETYLLAAIRDNPGISRLHSILGSTYLSKNDVGKAKSYFTKALVLDPTDPLANYQMGFLLHQEGHHDAARPYLEKVVLFSPTRFLYEVLTVALAWEMLDNKRQALLYYRRAVELNPSLIKAKEKVAALENSLASEASHGSEKEGYRKVPK